MTLPSGPVAPLAGPPGPAGARPREQSRARYPDTEGYVERDGVRVFYEVYGSSRPTIVFLPTWSIVHSRIWKGQIPYFARHFRVLTFDPRGNGRSDRPSAAPAYEQQEFAADAIAAMDETGTESAIVVGFSSGAQIALLLAAEYSERVAGAVFLAPHIRFDDGDPAEQAAAFAAFEQPRVSYEGWAKVNAHYWASNYRDFLEFFFSQAFIEPHSTKQIEDCVGYGLDTTPEVLIATMRTQGVPAERARELCDRVRCAVSVIHGSHDRCVPTARGAALAEILGTPLINIEGGGHCTHARDPVRINLLIREFVDRLR